MEKRKIWWALGGLGLACLGLALWGPEVPDKAVLAFPFAQWAALLRRLSLSGTAGDALAWALLVATALVPLLFAAWLYRRGRFCRADVLLIVLAPLLAGGLYAMVNPGLFRGWFQGFGSMVAVALGVLLWSVLAAWCVLRLLAVAGGGREKAAAALTGLLWLLAAVYVFLGAYVLPRALAESLSAGGGAAAVVGFLVDLISPAGGCAAAVLGAELIAALGSGFTPESAARAHRLSRVCAGFLMAGLLARVGWNALQLLLAPMLPNLSFQVELPLVTTCFVLAVGLSARLLEQGRSLQEENEEFI